MKRALGFTLLGFVYGSILFLCAFACAGFEGKGTYLPFGIYGAPLSQIPPHYGLFAAPFLWAFLGFLLGRGPREWAIFFLVLHLAGAAFVLATGRMSGLHVGGTGPIEQTLRFAPGAFWGGLGIYAGGQVAAWITALRMEAR